MKTRCCRLRTIHRGDVIVFKHPKMPERDLIKRTIGLPGETIELRDKRVYINGKPLDEPYAHFLFPTDAADVADRGRAPELRPADGSAPATTS